MGTTSKLFDIQRQIVAMKTQIDIVDGVNKQQTETLKRALRVIKIMQDALTEFSAHTEAIIKERAQLALLEALKESMPSKSIQEQKR